MQHHGAIPDGDGVRFRLWAPRAGRVDLVLEPEGRDLPLERTDGGFFETFVPGAGPGRWYRYRLDGGPVFPDPASRFQPHGVHGPSMVVDPGAYRWRSDAWTGLPQADLVFYELHVGAFSPEGTFDGVRTRLPYLKDLGVTAVELMPVADFPGRWNWGYDPAALFAPSRAYGTPDDLRALVDAAHGLGLAVFLDVVYNHLGPDGAYAAAFAPMFTDRHHTPWGRAINLDDEHSEGVRRLFVDNALHWLREYRFDGLRLDATHALIDESDPHFLAELSAAVAALDGPPRRLVAEDHRNLNTVVRPRAGGGYGLDGVWVDDFHHQVRNLTAGDAEGYYADFAGTTAAGLAETLRKGWFYDGRPTLRTGEPRGTDASGVAPEQCVYCIQNHDQVGNRPTGNRLTDDTSLSAYRAASALLLFAPSLPLLFMGQEWGASSPFLFFTDHEPELGRKVSAGRRREFEDFPGFRGAVPDPQDPETFRRSKLSWGEREAMPHAGLLRLYRDLLALRRALGGPFEAVAHGRHGLAVRRGRHHLFVAFAPDVELPLPEGARPLLHTEQPAYTVDPRPPRVRDGGVFFPTPAALLVLGG